MAMAEVAEPAERKQRGRREPNEERIRARNQRLILKAAIEVFSKKGFDGTPISEIAEKSGLPKANVYYYFESKEAIYRAVIAHLIQGWDDALTHIRPEADPRTALEGYVRAKLEYTRKNASESRLFASEIIRGAEYLTRADRQHMKDVTDKAVAIVDGWVAAGQPRTPGGAGGHGPGRLGAGDRPRTGRRAAHRPARRLRNLRVTLRDPHLGSGWGPR